MTARITSTFLAGLFTLLAPSAVTAATMAPTDDDLALIAESDPDLFGTLRVRFTDVNDDRLFALPELVRFFPPDGAEVPQVEQIRLNGVPTVPNFTVGNAETWVIGLGGEDVLTIEAGAFEYTIIGAGPATAVPLPAGAALLLGALGGLAVLRRR